MLLPGQNFHRTAWTLRPAQLVWRRWASLISVALLARTGFWFSSLSLSGVSLWTSPCLSEHDFYLKWRGEKSSPSSETAPSTFPVLSFLRILDLFWPLSSSTWSYLSLLLSPALWFCFFLGFFSPSLSSAPQIIWVYNQLFLLFPQHETFSCR